MGQPNRGRPSRKHSDWLANENKNQLSPTPLTPTYDTMLAGSVILAIIHHELKVKAYANVFSARAN